MTVCVLWSTVLPLHTVHIRFLLQHRQLPPPDVLHRWTCVTGEYPGLRGSSPGESSSTLSPVWTICAGRLPPGCTGEDSQETQYAGPKAWISSRLCSGFYWGVIVLAKQLLSSRLKQCCCSLLVFHHHCSDSDLRLVTQHQLLSLHSSTTATYTILSLLHVLLCNSYNIYLCILIFFVVSASAHWRYTMFIYESPYNMLSSFISCI